jgi:amino acid adenylation domain-containing protein
MQHINNGDFEYWNRDIVSVFEEQVARFPLATALVCDDEKLTYHALNTRANRLARHLRSLGAGQSSIVAICLERSLESVIGVLATLKSGAAYLPIDPQLPLERIRFMLNDSQALATLTNHTIMEQHKSHPFPNPVLLDDARLTAAYEDSNAGDVPAAAAPAYVMYTSGTTGSPKGAILPHSGVTRLVWRTNYVALDPSDIILHHSTPSFDAAVFEIWSALLNGATLAIYQRRTFDLDALANAICQYRVTTLLLTTSLFHIVVAHKLDCLASLRTVVTGGDVMQAKAVKRALSRHPHLRIINGYGPTENSTFTCCYVLTRDTDVGDTVPIGTPIAGTNVFILDDTMTPVRPGQIGELYTNGLGLAVGYLNRDELNRSHFVPCPFSWAGPVLYRTGDLVRQTADGTIDFVGRADNQLKIRGFRVEPGEIEHVINLHADVADCVVLAQPITSTEKQLVAYVKRSASSSGSGLDAGKLKQYLFSRLPQYMVPSFVYVVDDLPVTANGKLDRAMLRSVEQARQSAAREREEQPTAPQAEPSMPSPAEVVLETWRRHLGTRAVQADASIYDHGASSLTVMIVQSELDACFRCSIDPVELMQAQTPQQWTEAYMRHLHQSATHVHHMTT